MKNIIDWKYFAIFLVIASGFGFGISKWFEVSFWISFIIVAAALLAVGVVAVIEDNKPGGFNNPNDQEKKP